MSGVTTSNDSASAQASSGRGASLNLDFLTGDRVATSVYVANKASDATAAESWLNRPLDAIQLHQGVANWFDWQNSVAWINDQVADVAAHKMWSIGLIPWGATLSQAAAGKYDSKYVALAKQMVADAPEDGGIYIRLGWEMNSTGWNPWSANGKAEDYVGAYQKFVDAFRTVSDRFVFEWTPNVNTGVNPEVFYPGDDYVDVIGMDFYYNTEWHSKDGAKAFDWFVKQPWSLQWQQDFAEKHNKPTAIAEWGLNSDSPEFVKLAAKWFADHDMLYQNYWDSDSAFVGKLSSGQYPNAAAAFADAFALPVTAPKPAPSAPEAPSAQKPAPADVNLTGDARDNVLTGDNRANIIKGGDGNDVIDGGRGADIMYGGNGNDSFYVDNVGDQVIEWHSSGAGGIDTVYATIDYTLPINVENLTMLGEAQLTATGNKHDNIIRLNDAGGVAHGMTGDDKLYGGAGDDKLYGGIGNDLLDGGNGNDLLDGGTGADQMIGGKGNDVYRVDNVGDTIVEWNSNGEGGIDSVLSKIDFTLPINVENLTLEGKANLSGSGNRHDNILVGNAGANKLWAGAGDDIIDGGAGADTLHGSAGRDTFVFRAGEAAGDRVMDFEAGDSLEFVGYGEGAYATLSGRYLTIHYGGGEETITFYGSRPEASQWTFSEHGPSELGTHMTMLEQYGQ